MEEVKKEFNPAIDALWCKRCQRGMTGLKQAEGLVEGDDCPLCIALTKNGNIADNAVGVLKKVATVRKEHEEYVAIKKREKELKTIRHIKDAGELVQDEKKARQEEIGSLKSQIEELKKLLKNKSN